MDLSNMGNLGDLAKQMQDAYGEGIGAMNQAGNEVAEDMNPDYEIDIDIKLSAKVEGYDYMVNSKIIFNIELEPVLQVASSSGGDLSALLDGLDVDLGDDKDAVMEQLGQPRAIGVVKDIETKDIEVHNKEGKIDTDLNKDGTILATIKDNKILVNFESVLSYPDNTDVFVAIPSMEEMQKNIVVDISKITSKVEYSWVEKDKDNLKVSGSLKFKKI
jgi:hypothetical protein